MNACCALDFQNLQDTRQFTISRKSHTCANSDGTVVRRSAAARQIQKGIRPDRVKTRFAARKKRTVYVSVYLFDSFFSLRSIFSSYSYVHFVRFTDISEQMLCFDPLGWRHNPVCAG